jgi:hypothetical protein
MSETSDASAERRHSIALEPDLIKDPIKLAEAEAANGLRQLLAADMLSKRPAISSRRSFACPKACPL